MVDATPEKKGEQLIARPEGVVYHSPSPHCVVYHFPSPHCVVYHILVPEGVVYHSP